MEMLIVEGESAASSVQRCVRPNEQYVIALQGKPLNVLRSNCHQVESNPFLSPIVSLLRKGEFESSSGCQCTIDRVALLMDPDADGIHCGMLLLWFFRKMFPEWLQSGRVVQIIPPMYQIRYGSELQTHFAYTRDGADHIAKRLLDRYQPYESGQVRIAKVRGLGSLPAALLREFCVDPESRRQCLLTIRDADRGWSNDLDGGTATRRL